MGARQAGKIADVFNQYAVAPHTQDHRESAERHRHIDRHIDQHACTPSGVAAARPTNAKPMWPIEE